MSKYANVTLIPTVGPDQECRSFKLGMGPAGICKRNHHRSTDSNWFIASHGNFRHGDAMILIGYDGITCFIKACIGYTVTVNNKTTSYGMDSTIQISDDDIIQINDCWKVCTPILQVAIYYGQEQISCSGGMQSKYRSAPQTQIPTNRPIRNSVLQRHTLTQPRSNLENPTLNRCRQNTENEILKRYNRDKPKAGRITGKIDTFESYVQARKETTANETGLFSLSHDGDVLGFDTTGHPSNMDYSINQQEVNTFANESCLLSSATNQDASGYDITSEHMYDNITKQVAKQPIRQYENELNPPPTNCDIGYHTNHHMYNNIYQEVNTRTNRSRLLSSATYEDARGYDMDDNITEQVAKQQIRQYKNELKPPSNNCDFGYSLDHQMDNDFYQGAQMKGVSNMGMTCYANGIFQILAQTKLFLRTPMSLDKHYAPLTFYLWKLLQEMNKPCHQSNYLTVDRADVKELYEIIAETSSFSKYRQDDCAEFLLYILERLKTENDISTSMFEMNLQTVITHNADPHPHVDICDTQLSFHLLVPLFRGQNGRYHTVTSGLNKMLNVAEWFTSDNLPCRFCDSTQASGNRNRTIMKKLFVVSKAPDILILQIGRVESLTAFSPLRKKNVLVEYDLSLSIDEVQWDEIGNRKKLQYFYQLYGVVLHSGSINSGHYYCYVKSQNSSEWFNCSDERVDPIDQTMVLNKADAYLLFYEKVYRE